MKSQKLNKKQYKNYFPVHKEESDGDSSVVNANVSVKVIYQPSPVTQPVRLASNNLQSISKRCYKSDDQNNNSRCENNVEDLEKGQTLLTSYFTVKRKPIAIEEQEKEAKFDDIYDIIDNSTPPPLEITCDEKSEYESSLNKKTILKYRQQVLRKYLRFKKQKFLLRLRLTKRLVKIGRKSRKATTNKWHHCNKNKDLLFVYQCFWIFQVLSSSIEKMNNMNANKKSVAPTESPAMRSYSLENLMINKRAQRIMHDSNEFSDEPNSPVISHDTAVKRLPKSHKANENVRLKLLSENQQESTEKDFCQCLKFIAESFHFD